MSKRGVQHPTGVQPVRHDYSAHEHRTCNSALAATRTRTGECLESAWHARVSLDGPPGARLTLRAFRLSRTWQRASASEASLRRAVARLTGANSPHRVPLVHGASARRGSSACERARTAQSGGMRLYQGPRRRRPWYQSHFWADGRARVHRRGFGTCQCTSTIESITRICRCPLEVLDRTRSAITAKYASAVTWRHIGST